MLWTEVDLDAAVWRVSPERMKRKLEHEAPLSSSTARTRCRENPASAATYFKDAELAQPVDTGVE
jgi:hypothetical protein